MPELTLEHSVTSRIVEQNYVIKRIFWSNKAYLNLFTIDLSQINIITV